MVAAGKEIVRKDKTKNVKSRRTYVLLSQIKEMLLGLKENQDFMRRLQGNCYDSNDYVFKHEDGKPFRPDYMRKPFGLLLKEHGLPNVRIHDLRHSCASLLYKKGWKEKDVQMWLGHSNIRTTQEIYIHVNEMERKRELAEGLGNSFSESKLAKFLKVV